MSDHIQLTKIHVAPNERKLVDVSNMKRVEFLDDYTTKSGGFYFPFSLGATFGYQNFYNPKSAENFLSHSLFGGIFGILERFPFTFFNLGIDFSFSINAINLEIQGHLVSTRITQIQFGILLPFVYRYSGFKLFGGPRIGGALLIRQPLYEYADQKNSQSAFSFSPGILVGLGYTFFKKLTLDARFQSNYLRFGLDNSTKNIFSYLATIHLSWRFDVTFRKDKT